MSQAVLVEQPPMRIRKCRHGLFMYNVNDKYIGRSLDIYGEFSEIESDLFHQIVKPGMTVVDVGANIGAHTVALAKAVGSVGLVMAVEPQRLIYQTLCGNIALNVLSNVQAFCVALGKETKSIIVPSVPYNESGNFGGVSLTTEGVGDRVPLLTLDSFNLPQCNFLKIDVEGMELDVLEGAVQTLERCKPILYVENDRREKSMPLIEFLFKSDYRLYWHLPALFNKDNYFRNEQDVFPTLVSINMICIPRAFNVEMKNFVEITAENADRHIDDVRMFAG